jgi:hypothetical protein
MNRTKRRSRATGERSSSQVPGVTNVFAVGDVAASDPLRSSARNWGYRVIASNVGSVLRGHAPRRCSRAPEYRWGSGRPVAAPAGEVQHPGLA